MSLNINGEGSSQSFYYVQRASRGVQAKKIVTEVKELAAAVIGWGSVFLVVGGGLLSLAAIPIGAAIYCNVSAVPHASAYKIGDL